MNDATRLANQHPAPTPGSDALRDSVASIRYDTALCERLALANVSVWFDDGISGRPGIGLTLTDQGITCTDHLPDPDITVYVNDAVLADCLAGNESLAMAIIDGRVTYDGPVREFLRVLPVLRRQDAVGV